MSNFVYIINPFLFSPTVLWVANHEVNDVSEWEASFGGGPFPNGSAGQITTPSGGSNTVLALYTGPTMQDSGGDGARMFRWAEGQVQGATGDGLYYSVWFYIQQYYQLTGPFSFLNIFQFKSRAETTGKNDPIFSFNLSDLNPGYRLYLRHHLEYLGGTSYSIDQTTPVNFPTGQWVHLEAFYKGRRNATGEITVWQDGVEILHADNVQTMHADSDSTKEWSVNFYPDGVSDSDGTALTEPAYLYIDDARISGGRIYPSIDTPTGVPTQPPPPEPPPSTSPYDDLILATTGLIHYWPLDEASGTILDRAGTLNSSSTSGLTYESTSIVPSETDSKSILFDAAADNINFGSGTDPLASTDWTYEFALSPTSQASSFRQIMNKNDWTDGWSIQQDSSGTDFDMYMEFRTGGTTSGYYSINGLTIAGGPYHIVLRRTGTSVTAFVNGVQQGTSTLSAHANSSSAVLFGDDYLGNLSKVAIYNVALTGTVIGEHHTMWLSGPA